IAAAVIGDAAETLAEIGQLRLVDARVDNAPWRHEQHGGVAAAIDLIVKPDTIAHDEPVFDREFGTHDSPHLRWTASIIRMRSPKRRSDFRIGMPFFSKPSRCSLSAPMNALPTSVATSSAVNGPRPP